MVWEMSWKLCDRQKTLEDITNLKLALEEVEAEQGWRRTHEQPAYDAYVHNGTFVWRVGSPQTQNRGKPIPPTKNRRETNGGGTTDLQRWPSAKLMVGFSSQTTWQKPLQGLGWLSWLWTFCDLQEKSAPPEKIGETCVSAIEPNTRVKAHQGEKTVPEMCGKCGVG